jgi:hypothetical protein
MFKFYLGIVDVLLGISPASVLGLPTFRNILSVPSSKAGCVVMRLTGARSYIPLLRIS